MQRYNIANLKPQTEETREIAIEGMTCEQCVRTIEDALRGAPGVRNVKVDPGNARATVIFDNRVTNIPELHDILLKNGYKPTEVTP